MRLRFFLDVTGERARELLFLYGRKGDYLVRPSESNPEDYTISIHQGSRVTHVKIPFDNASNVYRFPSGQEFRSLEEIGKALSNGPDILTDCEVFTSLSSPLKIPFCETVVNVGRDRFFHISTSGHEAEALLRLKHEGTFLLRESTSSEGEFALSVKSTDAVIHVRVHRTNGRFGIVPKDNFRGFADLLDNYVRMPMVQNDGSAVKLVAALPTTRFTAATIDDRIDCLLQSQRKAGAKDGFVEEFEGLHREEDAQMFISCKEGRKTENIRKNRYRNVVPFDHTRIKLKSVRENDYINANYIKIPLDARRYPEFGEFRRSYISTQGCLEETVTDFWQMIWQEETRLIVMVTKEIERGRVKCFRYWPDLDGQKNYGTTDLTVKALQENTTDDYVHRLFSLSVEGSDLSRIVHHFQILGWEDNESCPVGSVLRFLHSVNECVQREQIDTDGPTVVHCSAGIGRTGTYIALDILTNCILLKGPQCVCDVQKTVRMLREQRATMVQTEAQYRFIYYVISAFMKSYRNNSLTSWTQLQHNDELK
ncbi:hypothetical protein niasHT_028071 [Heterodera trifolii]|uniref:protein-tyrosine-phosphatase n=1 Tax=Heterodera trifolii TaxID=157864 RepID=A0ABD2KEE4_9BILA